MIENVKVVLPTIEEEPTEEEVDFDSKGACFDDLPSNVQELLIKAYGSIESVRSQAFLNDCQ